MSMDSIISVVETYGQAGLIVMILVGSLLFATKKMVGHEIDLVFDKNIESYKAELSKEIKRLGHQLENSQAFFAVQMAALADLRSWARSMLPRKRHPEMDIHDAYEEVALDFKKHADYLDNYLRRYSHVLPESLINQIDKASMLANDGDLDISLRGEGFPDDLLARDITRAEDLYELVKQAAQALQETVNAQRS